MAVPTSATWLVVGALGLAAAAIWARVDHRQQAQRWAHERAQWAPRASADDASAYATSDACRECHPAAWSSWHASYHRTMTQLASRETIVAPWRGELPGGVALRFTGERPEIVRPGGAVDPVVMITGSHHMQIYWTPDRQTRSLVAFEYAWLIDAQRFVPNAATLVQPEGGDATYTWNRICIRCHAVAGNPGWRETTGVVQSETVELGIACEACHGPARAHAEAHRNPAVRWSADDAAPADIVQPRDRLGDAASEVCAQCHAITQFDDEDRWLREGIAHEAGDRIDRWGQLVRHPARADMAGVDDLLEGDPHFFSDRFWSDGMVRVTGREYNALVESPCHADEALSCLSCHDVHGQARDDQLRPGMDGDAACTPCHAGKDDVGHTRHAADGEGARCMSCHMPRTTWGLLGAIRSHQVDSPSADVGAATGRPVACNLCHLDRSLAWTAEQLAAWSGDVGTTETSAATEASAAIVGVLSGDAGARALWAWHLGTAPGTSVAGDGWQLGVLAEVLEDPYPAVREVAWQSIAARSAEIAAECAPPAATIAGPEQAACVRAAAKTVVGDRDGPAVLRNGGELDRAALAGWIAARDDRRVVLAE